MPQAGDELSSDSGSDTESIGAMSSTAAQRGNEMQRKEAELHSNGDDKAVFRMRFAMLMALLFSALAVSLSLYFFIDSQERSKFNEAYDEAHAMLVDSMTTRMYFSLGAFDSFMVDTVSQAKESGQNWPEVSSADFAIRAAKLISFSRGFLLSQYQKVEVSEREKYENYTIASDSWVREAVDTMKTDEHYHGKIVDEWGVLGKIYSSAGPLPYNTSGPFFPKWQSYPVVPTWPPYNWDGRALPSIKNLLPILSKGYAAFGMVENLPTDPSDPESVDHADSNSNYISRFMGPNDTDPREPFSDLYYPIIDGASNNISVDMDPDSSSSKFVGILGVTFFWRGMMTEVLPYGTHGVFLVVRNSCGQSAFTYQLNGPEAKFVSNGDRHDPNYDDQERTFVINKLKKREKYTGLPLSRDGCTYTVSMFPSKELEKQYRSSNPILFAMFSVLIILISALVFAAYDCAVQRRQRRIRLREARSNAIVTSLFPTNVHDRLFEPNDQNGNSETNTRLKSFLKDSDGNSLGNAPIADLFPSCTVMFCDISGFTAWSSIRQPEQVFILLESIYGAFDSVAQKRGVYKVETIGDSYVAVAGLPEPRKDHAVVMAKFARDCQNRMGRVVRDLEVTLGPDTSDLKMRFGLHSGSVTAGVLRGARSRFQLFGDTVNTAARMESTGKPDFVQASESTYDELVDAGKEHWCKPRSELVEAKGKGKMQTYWISPTAQDSRSTVSGHSEGTGTSATDDARKNLTSDKVPRLIEWNADVLSKAIQDLVASRDRSLLPMDTTPEFVDNFGLDESILNEVKEVISFPQHNSASSGSAPVTDLSGSDSPLDPRVTKELRDYVASVASTYPRNTFHCFEHASHVTMSVVKLLSRIVNVSVNEQSSSTIDHSYGIATDMLTQLACTFAALIHDIDHPGVPNSQLVKEGTMMAQFYRGKSVAEQNSFQIAWNLFMEEAFRNLRITICPTNSELIRFRQLLINCVMATDVMDKELIGLRNQRWKKAFDDTAGSSREEALNRKATIVLEHLIQASDIAHTMQHWHVYRKWNERLYEEMMQAYEDGRADSDPTDNWYQGELGFFDFYVIPLARKLKDCGVFGVSSDEYMGYAEKNRSEWELRGRELTQEMKMKHTSRSIPNS